MRPEARPFRAETQQKKPPSKILIRTIFCQKEGRKKGAPKKVRKKALALGKEGNHSSPAVTNKALLAPSIANNLILFDFSMAKGKAKKGKKAPAAAASQVEASRVSLCSLSSLSSDLLMHVAHFLSVKELCVLDTAITNKQLRGEYLSGLSGDTYLYPGAARVSPSTYDRWQKQYWNSEWQRIYAQWLMTRRVFVNSMVLDESTTATTLTYYDTANREYPGLESLSIHGNVNFPTDMAVRNAQTLHTLELRNMGKFPGQLRNCMASVREWGRGGGSLQSLTLEDCDFRNEVVDFGSFDSLTHLTILNSVNCESALITQAGESEGCTRLLWGILHKCKNLREFSITHPTPIWNGSSQLRPMPLSARDVSLLARFCPDLERLHIDTQAVAAEDAALLCVFGKCTKIQYLSLHFSRGIWDAVLLAIAANLVSLRSLTIEELELHDPQPLRCLAHGCPLLRELSIENESELYLSEGRSLPEAELLYVVQHAKNLQRLSIGQWEHMDFRDGWSELDPSDYAMPELALLGLDDPDAFIAEQVHLCLLILFF
jgi:hypothetical protein